MMGWHDGWGGHWMSGPFMWLWWVLIIAGVVVLLRWRPGRRRDDERGDSALAILRERYARGEIDKTEFDTRKRDLS